MNEFLLLALVIVYMAITYRPTSTEARNNQQGHHKPRGTHDD
jgi:hypothetical protein